MLKVAAILKGKRVAPSVSLTISPGSMQVLRMLSEDGALSDILGAGARLLECACRPCIGMGQSPNSGAISLRTFNRNFEGRSGTADAGVYLVSPEVAAASALTGVLTDPRTLGEAPHITMPDHFEINDNLIDKPASPEEAKNLEIVYGPNIKPVPNGDALPESIEAEVVLKVGDNITTDQIMPAGAKILPLPLERTVPVELLLQAVRRELCRALQAGWQGNHHRRQQLRSGLFERARGTRSAVSRHKECYHKVLCAHTSGKSHKRRYRAVHLRRPRRL